MFQWAFTIAVEPAQAGFLCAVKNGAGATSLACETETAGLSDKIVCRVTALHYFRLAMTPIRAVWFAVGLVALGLGAIGVFLPLLPTTPFILLAAFAFARSSKRWHFWLHRHKTFGPIIRDWRRHGTIGRRAKIVGVLSMAAVLGVSFALQVGPVVLAVQAIALIGAAAFLLSRPSRPKHLKHRHNTRKSRRERARGGLK